MSVFPFPTEWVQTNLGNFIVTMTGGASPKKTDYTSNGTLALNKGDIKQRGKVVLKEIPNRVPAGFVDAHANKIVRSGSALVTLRDLSTKADFLGLIALYSDPDPALITQGMFKLEVHQGHSESYLIHYSNAPAYRVQVKREKVGATQVHLRNEQFLNLKIPLPPLAEQKEIAARLDNLLAQVDSIKTRLDSIPTILKRFRQSVLAAAVSGKLTEEWRGENTFSIESWNQVEFKDICTEITVGFVGKMADKYQEEGVPFLRSQNVRAFRFSPDNILYISEDFHKEIFKSRLLAGDLAIVRSGAPGTTCVIPETLGIANCSDLVIARPNARLNSEFGCIFMNSEVAQHNVAANQVGVAQQHFNVGSMKKMPINLPLTRIQLPSATLAYAT